MAYVNNIVNNVASSKHQTNNKIPSSQNLKDYVIVKLNKERVNVFNGTISTLFRTVGGLIYNQIICLHFCGYDELYITICTVEKPVVFQQQHTLDKQKSR